MIVIFLSGPPKAGKSRLRGDLYQALFQGKAKSWFVVAASPDSEGQWVNDAHRVGRGLEAEDLTRKAKNHLKSIGEFFSPRWVETMARQLQGLCRAFTLVVADLGGLPSEQNRRLVDAVRQVGAEVRAVVLLSPDGSDGGWQEFWAVEGVSCQTHQYHEGLAKEILQTVNQA